MDRKRTPPSRGSNSSQPYREDCWSDGETSVLIDAWGDRYIELNRGNIPQKQWQEVADAVNSRPCDARRPPRTDIQCKYRVDTLKKKYKIEKNKMADTSSNVSQWQFFDRLEALIGSSLQNQNQSYGCNNNNNYYNMNSTKRSMMMMTPQPPLALPLPSNRLKGFPPPPPAAIAAPNANYDSDSSFTNNNCRKRPRNNVIIKKEKEKEDDGVAEMSKAIGKLVEIYEKVEMEKSKQMMELEKQRMEFAKSIEIQRMQMAVDMMKMVKKAKKSGGGEEDLSCYALNMLFQPNYFS